jgi:hypothetical protein
MTVDEHALAVSLRARLKFDATYFVPAGSPVRTLDQVDAEGVRVVARPRSAYDLFLRRSLAHAELVYRAMSMDILDFCSRVLVIQARQGAAARKQR